MKGTNEQHKKIAKQLMIENIDIGFVVSRLLSIFKVQQVNDEIYNYFWNIATDAYYNMLDRKENE